MIPGDGSISAGRFALANLSLRTFFSLGDRSELKPPCTWLGRLSDSGPRATSVLLDLAARILIRVPGNSIELAVGQHVFV